MGKKKKSIGISKQAEQIISDFDNDIQRFDCPFCPGSLMIISYMYSALSNGGFPPSKYFPSLYVDFEIGCTACSFHGKIRIY